jgi:hypothetical protein
MSACVWCAGVVSGFVDKLVRGKQSIDYWKSRWHSLQCGGWGNMHASLNIGPYTHTLSLTLSLSLKHKHAQQTLIHFSPSTFKRWGAKFFSSFVKVDTIYLSFFVSNPVAFSSSQLLFFESVPGLCILCYCMDLLPKYSNLDTSPRLNFLPPALYYTFMNFIGKRWVWKGGFICTIRWPTPQFRFLGSFLIFWFKSVY